jgi:hypothetical protein
VDEQLALKGVLRTVRNDLDGGDVASIALSIREAAKIKKARIVKLAKGFAFYSVDESVFADSEMAEIDMEKIELQPSCVRMVPWNYDLMWDLLLTNFPGDESRTSISSTRRTFFPSCNVLLFRRHIVSTQSSLDINTFGLFQTESSVRDSNGFAGLWSDWLKEEQSLLPRDYATVDFMFAEDTRFVNAGLECHTRC